MKQIKSFFNTVTAVCIFSVFSAAALSCGQIRKFTDLSGSDFNPPVLTSFSQTNEKSLRISFNEEIEESSLNIVIQPGGKAFTAEVNGNELEIIFLEKTETGVKYAVEGSIEDKKGNCLYFMHPFYGYNPDIPDLLINEFICQGTGNHPDLTELFVLTDGNLAGITLYEGDSGQFDDYYTFPNMEVSAGDYILVHFKPQGTAEEINETAVKDSSAGLDSSINAWDHWIDGAKGLSGNNGMLTLYRCPGGDIIDAVLYSNRTSSSDTKYEGFGSFKFLTQVLNISSLYEWISSFGAVRPEDCIDPTDSTSTRSICRNISLLDTNTANDWYITATSESTFGEENSPIEYVP